ncbi:MAG: M23 family metallopeptidase [Burkholderiales bacterium]|nr:M23 family metallopeptidase [Burkholderiales bacterium]
MHLIITDPWMAKHKAIHLTGAQLAGIGVTATFMLIGLSLATYHLVFVHGARQGWPVITPIVNMVTTRERMGQERYLKENLDAMARKLGVMQARLVQLDELGERVAVLAGLPAAEAKAKPGTGGPLVLPDALSIDYLTAALDSLDTQVTQRNDLLVHAEARLFTERMRKQMLPTAQPVPGVESGSGFGWRVDPVTGQRALHTGLDFSADVGTAILAAAGGVVVTQEFHPAYGNMVEIDHGNELITRYAHASHVSAKVGDIVKRGQRIASVGSTGRSTGPHLHFEVWLAGVAQDPLHFLRAPSEIKTAAANVPTLAARPAPSGR